MILYIFMVLTAFFLLQAVFVFCVLQLQCDMA